MTRLLWELASGMAYLHERSIVHRDLKPENVLLSMGARPHARICDFGISTGHRERKSANMSHTVSSELQSVGMGTSLPSVGTVGGSMGSIGSIGTTTATTGTTSRSNGTAETLGGVGTVEYMAPEVYVCVLLGTCECLRLVRASCL